MNGLEWNGMDGRNHGMAYKLTSALRRYATRSSIAPFEEADCKSTCRSNGSMKPARWHIVIKNWIDTAAEKETHKSAIEEMKKGMEKKPEIAIMVWMHDGNNRIVQLKG